ncbi:MAG: hypothetical protein GY799_20615 [Desulfobulbaceae bacterium]|nr:hypothetical protein [Desulfobulbaceae bacterium]
MERLVVELAEQMRTRFYGKYRGVVTSVDDPESMGRIQANVPEILGDEVSPWALPCTPYAGDGLGAYAVPPVGAGVWIEFEAGDPSRPIWTGCWWGRNQVPKNEQGTDATPPIKIFRTESGTMLSFDDNNQVISLSDDSGDNIVTIEVTAGKITVKGKTKAIVEAPQIELVENATHPVVFGDELITYLTQLVSLYQAHTHPGETVIGIPVTPAPPVPPFQAPTPSLISQKVKAG